MRHRSKAPPPSESDESSDDDAFTAFSRKKKIRKSLTGTSATNDSSTTTNISTNHAESKPVVPSSGENEIANAKAAIIDTSSHKRHHHQSSHRTAKMDALLQELQETRIPETSQRKNNVPDKIGSYCLPDEEDSTTNIFVGNLSPLTTEEQLSDIFRQFGDLYSVKIMWPRNPEEMARGRNTGFVCYMQRDDAQDAMDTLQDTDPLNNGRRMFLNWGRNVKKVVKRVSGGGIPIPLIRGIEKTDDTSKRTAHDQISNEATDSRRSQNEIMYDPAVHEEYAIRVVIPPDPTRFKFISTVASFVAKDGSSIEDRLLKAEAKNPLFAFAQEDNEIVTTEVRNERIFYRWRVFSFSQGCSYFSWRTEPFIMIQPGGHFWIPPPLDPKLVAENKWEEEMKSEKMLLLKQQRRQIVAARRGYHTTGRQIEKSRRKSADGHVSLSPNLLEEWKGIMDNLSCARESICEAMAFCFDNSFAAKHICKLLETSLLDNRLGISIETKCARLFLLSDILFNSQQIGVKNAFHYRDAIEIMAPDVFKRLGEHGNGAAGRITMNKLRGTVRKVLSAWNSWSVYNDIFLDRLEAMFEGKSFEESNINNDIDKDLSTQTRDERVNNDLALSAPSSIWMDSSNTEPIPNPELSGSILKDTERQREESVDGESCDDEEFDPSSLIDEEIDGESLGDSEIADSDYEEEAFELQTDNQRVENSIENCIPDTQN